MTVKRLHVIALLVGIAALAVGARGRWSAAPSAVGRATLPPATGTATIRFLENRVARDPEDFIALNKLTDLYLQRMRETGALTYLTLASRAVDASLAALPAEQNPGGLAGLARVEYSRHDFARARDHARRLAELLPGKGYPFQMLGDALLELGDYDGAEQAFRTMRRFGGLQVVTRMAMEQRRSRVAALHGRTAAARRHMTAALSLASAPPSPVAETVAWCRWQLGELAFGVGDLAEAERQQRDALTTFSDYFRALASLGRVRAARGDLRGAIEEYERAVEIVPDPSFVAALGDLYHLTGRDRDAATQYALVEQIARLGGAAGTLYDRQLALFYADHDRDPERAYALAESEYATRRDVYGSDALAWTALKAGRTAEAHLAMEAALRFGTRDARLLYHAGMVAEATGAHVAARAYLRRALALNPGFDPLQAPRARTVLAMLDGVRLIAAAPTERP